MRLFGGVLHLPPFLSARVAWGKFLAAPFHALWFLRGLVGQLDIVVEIRFFTSQNNATKQRKVPQIFHTCASWVIFDGSGHANRALFAEFSSFFKPDFFRRRVEMVDNESGDDGNRFGM